MRVLFVTATRIGDAVLSTSVLAHVIERYPACRVTVACGPAAAPLFAAVPNVERVIPFEKQPGGRHWLALWSSTVTTFWGLVVDLRASALAYLVPARRRIVTARHHGTGHRLEAFASLLGCSEPPAPRLWLAPEHEAAAERWLAPCRTALAIGPTAGWPRKAWPVARFVELVRRLTAPSGVLPGAHTVLLGAPDEREMTRPIADALDKCVDLVGQADLLTSYAVLRRCQLFVGNDSAPMHMAAASGIPTLGLFGPSRDRWYAPWGRQTAVVRTPQSFDELVGAPDYDRHVETSLMEGITVDMAEAAVRELWARAQEAA